jgi:uncharacterized protein YceH (UPF0502 family)
MSAPQTLIQAALQRLGARLGSSLIDAAATLSVLAQDAPDRLREEFQLFWQEVEAEAQRIEHGDAQAAAAGGAPAPAAAAQAAPGPAPADPQHRIDALRARIATLAQRLDQQ